MSLPDKSAQSLENYYILVMGSAEKRVRIVFRENNFPFE